MNIVVFKQLFFSIITLPQIKNVMFEQILDIDEFSNIISYKSSPDTLFYWYE